MEFLNIIPSIYNHIGLFRTILILLLIFVCFIIYEIVRKASPESINIFFNSILFRSGINSYGLFMNRMENIKNVRIKHASIKCYKKREIFIDFVSSRITLFTDELEDIYNKTSKMSDEELFLFMKEMMWCIFDKSDAYLEKFGMPKIFIAKFKELEDDNKKIMDLYIKQVSFSKYVYKNNRDKVSVMLDFIYTFFESMLVIGENVVDEINGHLNGISYKGIDCNNCPYKLCKKNGDNNV